MLSAAITIASVMMAVAMLLNLWRLVRGPDIVDRIVALDTLSINTIAVVVLFGIAASSTAYFEVALLIAMMGFVGTVVFCKFLLSGNIIEPRDEP